MPEGVASTAGSVLMWRRMETCSSKVLMALSRLRIDRSHRSINTISVTVWIWGGLGPKRGNDGARTIDVYFVSAFGLLASCGLADDAER